MKDWRDDAQLHGNFKDHRLGFMEMLGESENIYDRQLRPSNVAKHQIDLLSDDVRPAHSTSYRAGPTAGKFSVTEIDQMIAERLIEPATT